MNNGNQENREVTRREEQRPERIRQRYQITPAVDVYENRNELLLQVDMPGISRDNIQIRFEKNQLTLEGQADPDETLRPFYPNGYLFTRSFLVPTGIDPDRIEAELSNGVLNVHLPKRDTVKPRQISVRTA